MANGAAILAVGQGRSGVPLIPVLGAKSKVQKPSPAQALLLTTAALVVGALLFATIPPTRTGTSIIFAYIALASLVLSEFVLYPYILSADKTTDPLWKRASRMFIVFTSILGTTVAYVLFRVS